MKVFALAGAQEWPTGDRTQIISDRVIGALGLSKDELSKTTPLFQHRDSATLVIKFD